MTPPSIYAQGIPEPCPDAFNMARYAVGDPAARYGAQEALVVVDGDAPDTAKLIWSFAETDEAVRRAAGGYRAAGVKTGERVLIRVGDGPDFPVAFFGAIAAGAIAMPLSSQLSAPELAYIAQDAQPSLAVLSEDAPPDADLAGARRVGADILHGAAEDYAHTAKDDPAFLVYTSGSTGRPKGVLHAQRSAWGRRPMRAGWHDFGPEDRVMHAGAFNWTYTLGVGLSDPWSAGATAIVNTGSREADRWGPLARRWKPTVFAAVPGVYRRLLRCDGLRDDFASLRHALTAGEKLPPAIHDGWQAETGKPLLESLGMSEISTYISHSPTRQAGAGWSGWPQPGRRVAIVSEDGAPVPKGTEGLLAIDPSDSGLMLGYWQRETETDATRRGGWFITGDRALMREDGAIAYQGRNDDVMTTGGYRIGPQEIEECLAACPGVTEAAVAEYAVREGVNVIAAWIVGDASQTAMKAHCAEHLAPYKTPRIFFRCSALPRSANGKLRRKVLTTLDHPIE